VPLCLFGVGEKMRNKRRICRGIILLLLVAGTALGGQEVSVQNNLLTVQVHNIPLQDILQQIADQISIEITVQGDLNTMVSADFADADIADALRRIAPDFNSLVLYSDPKQKPTARISTIQLYAIAVHAGNDNIITLKPKPVSRK
jgi:hypothetical protein